MAERVKIFFDGGWRPGSGMETAIVVRGQAHVRRNLGAGSAMAAEWLALLQAVRAAQEIDGPSALLCGDALAVIAQATGAVACRGAHIAYRDALSALVGERAMPRIRHIKRSQNLAGIALARLHDR